MAKNDEVLIDEIRAALANAAKGRGSRPHFLTSYQILNRLSQSTKLRLISEHGSPGAGAQTYHSAASVIAGCLQKMGGEVERMYLDARGAAFDVDGAPVSAGYPVVGLYRLREVDPDAT
ncbi:hypothetical protein [Sorangium sp. So ce542]|uniref:hypothetical protein n=1 Tax=Sorangium sp. So ce542 TaxID=3133316 RepID=UPI003F608A03